jgi:outer membrane protein assembly factor BamD
VKIKKLAKNALYLIFFVLVISCSEFKRIQRSDDWRIKYDASMKYYEKKDYYRAATLFEDIRPVVRGLPEGEKVEFYLAYCQYFEGTYLLASTQFRTFFETYGRSTLSQEAYFMYAYSLAVSAPSYNHDQTSTLEAMTAMQNFINQYPQSEFTDRANEVIVASQQKLERKGYEGAKLYLRMKRYKAATIAFDNFKKTFPDSPYLEELAFLKVQAQYKLALISYTDLQVERYSSVITFYQELVDNFPESKFLKEAEKYYTDSQNQITKLKTNNS